MSDESKKQSVGNNTNAGTKNGPQEEVAPHTPEFDRMMERFQNEVDNFIDSLPRWRSWMRDFPILPSRQIMMASVDLEDRGKDFCITADLPGLSKEDVGIEVTDDSVIIRARKLQGSEDKNRNYLRKERTAQTFYRRLQLPERVNPDEAKASLTNGTLEITLPKREPKQTKTLTIT